MTTTNVCGDSWETKPSLLFTDTKKKLESAGTQLGHVPYKTLQHFAQEMGISV
jgi:hypothetical protein